MPMQTPHPPDTGPQPVVHTHRTSAAPQPQRQPLKTPLAKQDQRKEGEEEEEPSPDYKETKNKKGWEKGEIT